MNRWALIKRLLDLSDADVWDDAVFEWQLVNRYFDEDKDSCLCGHYPIKEIVVFENKFNGNVTKLGNCCETILYNNGEKKSIYPALKEKRINKELIKYSRDMGYINEWEENFLFDTYRKRVFRGKQVIVFNKISSKLFFRIKIEAERWKKK